jgi:hypothetical protein
MAKVFEVSAKDLARRFREIEEKRPEAIVRAIRNAATAGAEALATVAPVGVSGQFKTKLRAENHEHGAAIVDDAPYAGIIELGARPHWAPLRPLFEWFRYKLALADNDAWRAAHALQQRIASVGQKPTYFFRKRLRVLRKILREEVERALKEG